MDCPIYDAFVSTTARKRVELRFATHRLDPAPNRSSGPYLRDLNVGDQFVYEQDVGHERRAVVLVVNGAVTAHESRGHAYAALAARGREADLIPPNLTTSFASPYPAGSVDYGNHFYYHHFTRSPGGPDFDPQAHSGGRAVAVPVDVVGVLPCTRRRSPSSSPTSPAAAAPAIAHADAPPPLPPSRSPPSAKKPRLTPPASA